MTGLNPDELNVGGYGGVILNAGEQTPIGKYGCIMPYVDTTFTTVNQDAGGVTNAAGTAQGVFTGLTWPAGVPIFGAFNFIKVATGRVIAYRYREMT